MQSSYTEQWPPTKVGQGQHAYIPVGSGSFPLGYMTPAQVQRSSVLQQLGLHLQSLQEPPPLLLWARALQE